MIDKAESEFEKIRKKHSKHIKIATINFDKNMMLKSVDVQLKPSIVVYVADFKKKSTDVEIDVGDAFQVSKEDILKGNFAKSFDGFYAYSGANGKLGLLMGLGYLFGNDIEIITPKFLGGVGMSIDIQGMSISTIAKAVQLDVPEIYGKKETAGQKTDNAPKQRPAGIGATKGKVSTFVYIVREVKSISEKSGLPIYGKLKQVSVRRVDQKSAENYVKSMYSYKKTGKLYFVELKKIEK